MKQAVLQRLRALLAIAFSVILVGCKVELYSGLEEKEGNEMLSILMENNIHSEKLVDKDKIVTLMVESSDVSKSVQILSNYGYPREKYSSIGDIFPKDGLISSPTEERARYTYSMSQELSSTLSMIDGVVVARVHVVLPQEQDSLTDVNYPSSASVFIKYTTELELAGFTPKVKTLVANSIEGLALEKITVSLFPATRLNASSIRGPSAESVLFMEVPSSTAGVIRLALYALLLLLLFGAAGGGYLYWQEEQKKKRRKAQSE